MYAIWLYYFTYGSYRRFTTLSEYTPETTYLIGYSWGFLHALVNKGVVYTWTVLFFETYALGFKLIYAYGKFDTLVLGSHIVIFVYGILTYIKSENLQRKNFEDLFNMNGTLHKFKIFVAQHLPASLLILGKEKNEVLFQNKTFEETFNPQGENCLNILGRLRENSDEISSCNSTPDSIQLRAQNLMNIIKEKIQNYTGQSAVETTCVHWNIGQKKKTYETKILPIPWDGQDAFAVILNDISYQKEIISLKIATENQEKAISVVAHELRNPVSGLYGLSRLMEKNINSPLLLKQNIQNLKINVDLLLNILNSVLDIQQIRANKLTLNITEVDVPKLLSNIELLYKFQFEQKNLSFIISYSPILPKRIRTDPNRLSQILINLVANALKFTSKGSVTIEVVPDPQNNSKVVFKVIDTGIGIKSEDRDKLFKAFGKLQSTLDMNHEGIGLGLMISNSLVKTLNRNEPESQISIESDGKLGTTLYFSIYQDYCCEGKEIPEEELDQFDEFEPSLVPSLDSVRLFEDGSSSKTSFCLSPAKENDSRGMLRFFSSVSSDKLRQKPTVLVVDDSPFNVVVTKEFFENQGFICYKAYNGQQALDTVLGLAKKSIKMDLVLMDFEMPIMDGLTAAALLKEKVRKGEIPDFPIIGLSAFSGPDIEKKSRAAGMSDYILKPLKDEDFVRIGRILKNNCNIECCY